MVIDFDEAKARMRGEDNAGDLGVVCGLCRNRKATHYNHISGVSDYSPEYGWPEQLDPSHVQVHNEIYSGVCSVCLGNIGFDPVEPVRDGFLEWVTDNGGISADAKDSFLAWMRWWGILNPDSMEPRTLKEVEAIIGVDLLSFEIRL